MFAINTQFPDCPFFELVFHVMNVIQLELTGDAREFLADGLRADIAYRIEHWHSLPVLEPFLEFFDMG